MTTLTNSIHISQFLLNNKIIGIYGDHSFGKTCFLINSLLELNYNYFVNIYFITKEDISLTKEKFLLSATKESKENININLFDELKNNSLKRLKNIKLSSNILDLKQTLVQKIDPQDKNIIFIDDLDDLKSNFMDSGESFLRSFKKTFINSNLIYSFKLPILSGYEKESNAMLAIREFSTKNLLMEDLGNKDRFSIPIHKNSYAFDFPQRYFVNSIKKCSCGAIKTFGKKALTCSSYHSISCDFSNFNISQLK